MNCLLCGSGNTQSFRPHKKPHRDYFHCQNCDVIFMDPQGYLTREEELARYQKHENEDTPGYRAFFAPLIEEIRKHSITPQPKILDYGCGPTGFLSKLLQEQNISCANYDPFFHSDKKALQEHYDVLCSTEVWEHLHHPRTEIQKQLDLLKPQGLLAIMTSAHEGVSYFEEWSYRRDLTHVVLYSAKSMKYIAQEYNLKLLVARSPYWIFQK